MLIQSLVLIATMLVLAGAILTSTLVSAKAILHETILAKTQTAMTDATEAFVDSMATSVKTYGTEVAAWPATKPFTETLCSSGRTDVAAPCPYLATISWIVTGSSAAAATMHAKAAASSDAAYLATAVDEQRISATISVRVSDATGTRMYGERSREITARIFDATPYVVITGAREIASGAGTMRSSEGDTAGVPQQGSDPQVVSPTEGDPAAFTDTRILTSIDCENSVNSANPIGNAYFDPTLHPYGNFVFAYESSCSSGTYATNNMPSGYVAPSGSLFVAQPADPNTPWSKGDENTGAFPR